MTRLTLVLFVDALARDYVPHTSFVRRLAGEHAFGALREDLGFLPRGSYFGGLEPSQIRFTNMYCCDPAGSPFGVVRGLPLRELSPAIEESTGARTWIDQQARTRVPAYAARYLSSHQIPLPLLPWFDVVEKYAPYDRRVGYRSLFHELDDLGVPYFYLAWPDTNRLSDHSDAAIVRRALEAIRPPHRLAVIHLQELDGVGHAFGPQSRELLSALDATDALVETLVTTLRSRFDAVDVVLFSDHGMVPVTGTTDVAEAIASTGLELGRDVVYFLDSTMARFWFPRGKGQDTVRQALRPLAGRVLDTEDLDRLDIANCDSRNGELIFLAHPGIVIAPNFFQGRHEPKGMHGYEPDCYDNHGVFLVADASSAAEPVDLGVVRPTAVYAETMRLLGLDAPVASQGQGILRLRGTFTQDPDPAAHALIRGHLQLLVDETLKAVPHTRALLLGGSFGRDEGSVSREDGRPVPLNDYDLVVVVPGDADAQTRTFRALGETLATRLGLDFVHFSVWSDIDPALPLTIANYDIRYGSRLLFGDPAVISALPRYAAADIPLEEGLHLICNRLGGLLTAMPWPENEARAPHERNPQYLANQVIKGLIALGDWYLLRVRAYDASYLTRLERFRWLACGLGLPHERALAIELAYRAKLWPDTCAVAALAARAPEVAAWLVDAQGQATATIGRRSVASATDAAQLYCEITERDADVVRRDNQFAATLFNGDRTITVRPAATTSVRQAIYSSLPLMAAAAGGDRDAFDDAGRRLGECLSPPWPRELTPQNWELARQRLSYAWLTLVH